MVLRLTSLIAAGAAFTIVPVMAQEHTVDVDRVSNWPAPLYWQPSSAPSAQAVHHGRIREDTAVKAAATTPGTPAVFVAMSPCRVIETRNPDGPYGGPASAAGEIRTYAIPAGPCAGIPATAVAFSVNVAVIPLGTTMRWLTAWDTGSTQPTAATLNDKAGLITSNSAVVPAGTGGEINIFVTDPTHVIVDINGYYVAISDLAGNTAVGTGALANNTSGDNNTATGYLALQNNTFGSENTANGYLALNSNIDGNLNTAIGYLALQSNTGNGNTAIGDRTLTNNINGFGNTATGVYALSNNLSGNDNTATGHSALSTNMTGNDNTAIGFLAMQNNTTGEFNTAIGAHALNSHTTGDNNIAIGFNAANLVGSNSNNIHIGTVGSIGDSATIRIGGNTALLDPVTQTQFFASGIRGVTTGNADAIPVVIDSNGQLGTVSSSRRVKRDIQDMGDTTDTILALHPVRFRYQAHAPDSPLQYGLIAEEVAEIAPDLVARNKDGEIETVFYDKVNAMLLNEVQKLHRANDVRDRIIEKLESRVAELEQRAR